MATCECRGKASYFERGSSTCREEYHPPPTGEYIAHCEAVLCEVCCVRSSEFGLCCACGEAITDAHFRPLPVTCDPGCHSATRSANAELGERR
jgi:hypothetical protein